MFKKAQKQLKRVGTETFKVLVTLDVRTVTLSDLSEVEDGALLSVCFERGGKVASSSDKKFRHSSSKSFEVNEPLSLLATLYRDQKTSSFQEKKGKLILRQLKKSRLGGEVFKGLASLNLPLHTLTAELSTTGPERKTFRLEGSKGLSANVVANVSIRVSQAQEDDNMSMMSGLSDASDISTMGASFDPDIDSPHAQPSNSWRRSNAIPQFSSKLEPHVEEINGLEDESLHGMSTNLDAIPEISRAPSTSKQVRFKEAIAEEHYLENNSPHQQQPQPQIQIEEKQRGKAAVGALNLKEEVEIEEGKGESLKQNTSTNPVSPSLTGRRFPFLLPVANANLDENSQHAQSIVAGGGANASSSSSSPSKRNTISDDVDTAESIAAAERDNKWAVSVDGYRVTSPSFPKKTPNEVELEVECTRLQQLLEDKEQQFETHKATSRKQISEFRQKNLELNAEVLRLSSELKRSREDLQAFVDSAHDAIHSLDAAGNGAGAGGGVLAIALARAREETNAVAEEYAITAAQLTAQDEELRQLRDELSQTRKQADEERQASIEAASAVAAAAYRRAELEDEIEWMLQDLISTKMNYANISLEFDEERKKCFQYRKRLLLYAERIASLEVTTESLRLSTAAPVLTSVEENLNK